MKVLCTVLASLMLTAAPARSEVVYNEPLRGTMFALGDTVFFPAMRLSITNGSRTEIPRTPPGAVTSLGINRKGHIAAVLVNGKGQVRSYDVQTAQGHRLAVHTDSHCSVEAAAAWRTRIAFVEVCRNGYVTVVSDGRGRRRFPGVGSDGVEMMLRGKTLIVRDGDYGDEGQQIVWKVLENGEACRDTTGAGPTDGGLWGGLTPTSFMVAYGDRTATGGTYDHVHVTRSVLTGCHGDVDEPGYGETEDLALPPETQIRSAALSGEWFYYATDTDVERLRLPVHG